MSSLKGKHVFIIPITTAGLGVGVYQAQQEIAEKVGIELTYYSNQGEVASWVQGMQTAIAQKPDIIILGEAPDPQLLQP